MDKTNLKSHEIFEESRRILGVVSITKLFVKGRRHIYAWCADPDYNGYYRKNPLDKLQTMLSELYKKGEKELVKGALNLLLKDTEYRIGQCDKDSEKETSSICDKKDKELSDLIKKMKEELMNMEDIVKNSS